MSQSFDRKELKFLVDDATMRRVTRALSDRLLADPHGDEQGCYPVVTVYYDSPNREARWQHAARAPVRRKLRCRRCGDPAGETASFVELKYKTEGRSFKRRVGLSAAEAMAACRGEPLEAQRDAAAASVLSEVSRMVSDQRLEPACAMRYERRAFVGGPDEPDLRVTIDSDLRLARGPASLTAEPEAFTEPVIPLGRHVLEVKVPGQVPYWLSRLLNSLGCTLSSHSKYAEALEKLDDAPDSLEVGGIPRETAAADVTVPESRGA